MIRIDIPATSANLGSGFDSLGIALTMCNRVWMEEADELKITTTDKIKVPTDETNLIYWAARHLYQICGKTLPGLHIIQENNIPMARGLGSSSACIVAGILGANRMLGSPMSQSDLINLAAQIEGHPDNTSPAISGGLVASAMEGKRVQRFRAGFRQDQLCGDDPAVRAQNGESPRRAADGVFPRRHGV